MKKKQKIKSKDLDNNEIEARQPNHWTYDDDPLLNMDPKFTDDPEVINKIPEQVDSNSGINSNEEQIIEAAKKISIIKQNVQKKPKSELFSIIQSAREISNGIQNEVLENDPVIAKLAKIEELRKTGGTNEELYTDLTKSNTSYYSERAKEFHSVNQKMNNETGLERARRLEKEAQDRRGVQNNNNNNFQKRISSTLDDFEDNAIWRKKINETIDFDSLDPQILERIENLSKQREEIALKENRIKQLAFENNLLLKGGRLERSLIKQEKDLEKKSEFIDKTLNSLEKSLERILKDK